MDDGSTDSCGKKCDEYAAEDKRIKVIHQKNIGLSGARNAGLKRATGKYVFFVDSDDWIEPETISALVSVAQSSGAKIVECGYCVYTKGKKEYSSGRTGKIISYSALQAITSNLKWGDLKPMTWNKLYRRSLFYRVRFPVGKYHEDEFITYKLYYRARKILFLDRCFYNYDCTRDDSITARFSIKNLDKCEAFLGKIDFVKKHSDLREIMPLVCDTYCYTFFENLSLGMKNGLQDADLKRIIWAALNKRKDLKEYGIHNMYCGLFEILESGDLKKCIKEWNNIKNGEKDDKK